MTGLVVGFSGLVGLVVGSFLNVVIARVPVHESIVRPRSRCVRCRHEIAPRDNIPVLSWLALRGRCRHCGEPISPRYPLVEITCAGLFAATAARIGPHWELAPFLVCTAGLLALSITDLERHLLPVRIVYPTLFLSFGLFVLAAGASHTWRPLLVGMCASAGWFAVFFAIHWLNPRYLGFGDVRLAALLGLGLGWLGVGYVLIGFFAANLIGLVVCLALIAAKHLTRESRVPYGVFLALGWFFALYAGQPLLAHWSMRY